MTREKIQQLESLIFKENCKDLINSFCRTLAATAVSVSVGGGSMVLGMGMVNSESVMSYIVGTTVVPLVGISGGLLGGIYIMDGYHESRRLEGYRSEVSQLKK